MSLLNFGKVEGGKNPEQIIPWNEDMVMAVAAAAANPFLFPPRRKHTFSMGFPGKLVPVCGTNDCLPTPTYTHRTETMESKKKLKNMSDESNTSSRSIAVAFADFCLEPIVLLSFKRKPQ